jgi:hypothetical protein
VKEDMKMYSTNLSILLDEKNDVAKEIAELEEKIPSSFGTLHALRKRKRELICTDMYKLINKNCLLGVMMKFQRDLINHLDEFD